VRAIRAGADVALTPPDPKAAVDALEAAVKSGQLSAERVDESVRRLLAAKYRLGLARQRFVDPAAVNRVVERPENVREAQRVAEASMTLLRNRGDVLPLDAAQAASTLFVVIAADEDEEEGRVFIPQVQRRAKGARVLRIGPRASASEHEAALAEAQKAERVVVAAFVKRAASKGTVALPEAQAELVRKLIATKKPLAVVAFAGPYLIRQFEDAPA
jgi:beta-N-acetylhexosaminidase